jgi:hypothetical protein
MHCVRVKRTTPGDPATPQRSMLEILGDLGPAAARYSHGETDILLFTSLPIARESARRLKAAGLLR